MKIKHYSETTLLVQQHPRNGLEIPTRGSKKLLRKAVVFVTKS